MTDRAGVGMTEVKPVAWKCGNCGHTSSLEGAGDGENWCSCCGTCNTMRPCYDQAALDALRAEERERLRMWLMEMHERDKARHNYWACAAVELFGRATPSGEKEST